MPMSRKRATARIWPPLMVRAITPGGSGGAASPGLAGSSRRQAGRTRVLVRAGTGARHARRRCSEELRDRRSALILVQGRRHGEPCVLGQQAYAVDVVSLKCVGQPAGEGEFFRRWFAVAQPDGVKARWLLWGGVAETAAALAWGLGRRLGPGGG